ncbi:hypothetical protein [Clostridium sp. D43t1_170807_H7]|uniref:hypothetical protein n=1 Tax=Clostridium sp. D43t1_170807_H7 TaxID=2787140 RepID=UPI00189A0E20|nr:hypothetical protein [Clostridium sp. D43t1_170807_H7]
MKNIKVYFVTVFTIIIILFLISMMYFNKSFEVLETQYVPLKSFALYIINHESVDINFINIIIVSLVGAVPISLLFTTISKKLNNAMKIRGKK